MSKRVLSVGNCGPDNQALTAMLRSEFQAEVVPTDDLSGTMETLRREPCDLVLVNRILDRDGSEGLEVIRELKADAQLSEIPVMMITNFPEHQQTAQRVGALEGFGKSSLQSPETLSKLQSVLR